MIRTIAACAVVALLGLCAASCGSSGNDPACIDEYGLVADGSGCDEDGDSHSQCPEAKCTCSGSTSTSAFICFDGKCVTKIGNCAAWCAASSGDREACF